MNFRKINTWLKQNRLNSYKTIEKRMDFA
jgi:hypothetical protein